MAKRVSVVKYETDEVQGEGSYVVLSALKVKEIRALRQKGKDDETDAFEGGLEILAKHVVDWNWVDDDGKPLDLPKDNSDVIDELTNEEAELLSELLIGDKEAKN